MAKKPKMIIVTHSFPYGSAERSFLQPEVDILNKFYDISYVTRNIKDDKTGIVDIESNIYRYDSHKNYNIVCLVLKTLFAKDFWKELKYILIKKKKFFKCIKQTISIYMRTLHFGDFLREIRSKYAEESLIWYTYWNGYETFACEKIKSKNDVVISRTHGGDLYLKEDNNFYQPYKDIMNQNIDCLYFISDDGLNYYQRTFKKLKENQIFVSRLGTRETGFRTQFSKDDSIHIITLSRVFWVKRIDKLIETLSEIDDIKINWTHIGDGELYTDIVNEAKVKLEYKENIKYNFVGNFSNKDVYTFLESTVVDLIVNVSYSEGLPVSIMEAMACGIPALAVSVGGIPEIVLDGVNGFLIDRDFTVNEFSDKLKKYIETDMNERQKMHDNAYMMWKESYCAATNHYNFATNILRKYDENKYKAK